MFHYYKTSGIVANFQDKEINAIIKRFLANDWGDISQSDKALNNKEPQFALGVYYINKIKVYVQRENDVIIIMLPSER